MASAELQRLWKLSQVDTGILEIRKRAGALDVGQAITAEINALKKQDEEVGGKARALSAEQKDIELQQKTIDDKLARIDKELYGGKVTSSREVETLEKEIASLKRQKDRNDDRLLELMDLVPPAKAAADKIAKAIEVRHGQLAERKKQALAEKTKLEEEFKRLNAVRPTMTQGISPTLMARYESLRQRASGIGMVEVTKQKTCAGCGMSLPERTIETLKEDKVATCEACHRLLYYTEGVI